MQVCVDRVPGYKQYRGSASPYRLAADKQYIWPQRYRSLSVRFLGGDLSLCQRVAAVACEWNEYTGLPFVFDNAPDAPIRVAFVQGDGSWSYVGTDSLTVLRREPTLNLGWLDAGSPEDELRRVVLHEFGHALGLIHEHNSPSVAIPWDKEAVYAYYAGPPNRWTREMVDHNVLKRYAAARTNYSEFDPHSIMLYPVSAQLTAGRMQIGWNNELSETDKLWIGKLYPPIPDSA
jgi:hypothetical protein